MPKDSPSASAEPTSMRALVPLTQPLRHRRYRELWIANLISNLGTWTQTFASAWLIASLSHSASTITLVQTATYVPIFLFAIFAGVLADAVDRPKFLFACNCFMALCACAMAALVMSGHATAAPVLLLTFCLGSGSAFMWPAWQASMSALVQPDELEAAATLNNLSYNVAAIAGPALGGVLFNYIGAGALFIINALSFTGLLWVYWSWSREARAKPPAQHRHYWASLKDGFRAALGSPRYRHILLNVCTVFFATIAFAALLPVLVRDVLKLDSGTFGSLMGSLGAGAVLAAFGLPTLRTRMERTDLLVAALLVYGTMLLAIPFLHSRLAIIPMIVCGGMAWSAIVSTMNAAAQASFPSEIRARTLAIYLFTMAAGYTAGSLVWGHLADAIGVQAALAGAGACLIINAILLARGKSKNPL